ncbi:hypothetical protein B0H12DRAFT_451944 [Mycena haematopus]|nr:hypothetical protein B0H12DRAFT_451944 [Mycena haematopus]
MTENVHNRSCRSRRCQILIRMTRTYTPQSQHIRECLGLYTPSHARQSALFQHCSPNILRVPDAQATCLVPPSRNLLRENPLSLVLRLNFFISACRYPLQLSSPSTVLPRDSPHYLPPSRPILRLRCLFSTFDAILTPQRCFEQCVQASNLPVEAPAPLSDPPSISLSCFGPAAHAYA